MKKLLLLTLAACLTFSMAYAQVQNPDLYKIAYGNPDGSPMVVGLDKDINVPCYGTVDPGDTRDTIATMFNPLKSANSIITARTGGFFPTGPDPIYVGGWDLHFFTNAVAIGAESTSTAILGIADLGSGSFRPINAWWFPDNNFHYIGTFTMHTANDPALIGTSPCPFAEGWDPANGTLLWGLNDGLHQVIPIATYSCLFFSPNQTPVWTVFPSGVVNGTDAGAMTFPLAGTDADVDNNLTITQTAGPGVYTPLVQGPGGNASGFWTWATPTAGDYVASFDLFDGTDHVPLDVQLHVTAFAGLVIDCMPAFPGEEVRLPVKMFNGDLVGGFDILINFDPTVLTLLGVDFTARDDFGNEYNNVHMEDSGPGTVRVTYIADVNNGVYHAPIGAYVAPDAAIFYLVFRVAGGDFLFGTHVEVNFLINDYRDNTISDETGYVFYHPPLTNGCVDIASPDQFKGDPNMNGYFFEVGDVVLVAQRLIVGNWSVWTINPPVQEAAADLNNNGFADVADLVRFINILNGYIDPPKLDPTAGNAEVTLNGNTVMINSGLEVGAVLVKFDNAVTATNNSNMDMLSQNGSVLVYSVAGNRIAAGNHQLFTINGNANITSVSVADAYGRLMNTARVAPIPSAFGVAQNYPNPFNAKTQINFALPTASDVSISIYNVTGQLVQSISGRYDAGYQSVTWDASNVASGIYFYKIAAGDFTQTMKMTLLK